MNRSVKLIVTVVAASLGGNLACAQFHPPADKPAPRADRNSQIAHEQLLEKARKGGLDVYFLGDSICIEAAELQEIFLWKSPAEFAQVAALQKEGVQDEIADIAVYLFELADNLDIDLIETMEAKLVRNAKKYPAEQVRGSPKKYTEYLQKGENPV